MEAVAGRNITSEFALSMGAGEKIRKIWNEIRKKATHNGAILVSGESPCCHERVAKAIHLCSPRSEGPFVEIDLGVLPAMSAAAEVFGNGDGVSADRVKGSTKIQEATGGTLFLRDIARSDIVLQKKLLKVVQGTSEANSAGKCDVKVICSTFRNLRELVKQGLFMEDLYETLTSAHIKVPSLRERKEDIIPLAEKVLEETAEKFHSATKKLSKEARDFLLEYHWPGDMAELEGTMRKAACLSSGSVITKQDLFLVNFNLCSINDFLEEKLKRYLKEMTGLGKCNLYATVVGEVEKSLISMVMHETAGNQVKAAKTLGINRNTLRSKIKEYKIPK